MFKKTLFGSGLFVVMGLILIAIAKPTKAVALSQAEMRQVHGGEVERCWVKGTAECDVANLSCSSTKCVPNDYPDWICPGNAVEQKQSKFTYNFADEAAPGVRGKAGRQFEADVDCISNWKCNSAGVPGNCPLAADGYPYCRPGIPIGKHTDTDRVTPTSPKDSALECGVQD